MQALYSLFSKGKKQRDMDGDVGGREGGLGGFSKDTQTYGNG